MPSILTSGGEPIFCAAPAQSCSFDDFVRTVCTKHFFSVNLHIATQCSFRHTSVSS